MAASQRRLKQTILPLLLTGTTGQVLEELSQYPPEKLLNPLFSGICQADGQMKWNAVSAMGATVARIANQDMEAARVVMRRFMWSLNDESGGIGWGVPEAIGECLANHAGLAEEYTHILVSFMREDGFYLEHLPLQQGLMWGVGRLAQVRPVLLGQKNASTYLLPYLDSPDPVVRALAARALGFLKEKRAREKIELLLPDTTAIPLFHQGVLEKIPAGALACQALHHLQIQA